MPSRLREPAQKDEVEDSESDPEDDERQEKAIGAEARDILWPDHSNGQDEGDRQQTNTRQPIQPFPCCEALIHCKPAPSSRHPQVQAGIAEDGENLPRLPQRGLCRADRSPISASSSACR